MVKESENMNSIWWILILLCCCNHNQCDCEDRDGCGRRNDCGRRRDCDCRRDNERKNDCGCKKEYCPDQMQTMPFQRGNDGSSHCCEMQSDE